MLWDGQGRPDLNTTDMVCCDYVDVVGWELLLLKKILWVTELKMFPTFSTLHWFPQEPTI